jgi:hypothetical protein
MDGRHFVKTICFTSAAEGMWGEREMGKTILTTGALITKEIKLFEYQIVLFSSPPR